MSIGDYVVFSDGVNAHIGVIKSDYYYEVDGETRDIEYVNNRKVKWLKTISRDILPKVFKNALASARSVFSLNAYKSIVLELLEKGSVDIYDEIEDDNMEEEKLTQSFILLDSNISSVNSTVENLRTTIQYTSSGIHKLLSDLGNLENLHTIMGKHIQELYKTQTDITSLQQRVEFVVREMNDVMM